MQEIEEASGEKSGLDNHLPSRDIVRIPDSNGRIINFYTTLDSYNDIQKKHMEISRRELNRDFSLDEFIPRGHVPIYNGSQLKYHEGCLYLIRGGREVLIAEFDPGMIEYLNEHGIEIGVLEKKVA